MMLALNSKPERLKKRCSSYAGCSTNSRAMGKPDLSSRRDRYIERASKYDLIGFIKTVRAIARIATKAMTRKPSAYASV
jgi:hypothetical protein